MSSRDEPVTRGAWTNWPVCRCCWRGCWVTTRSVWTRSGY
jgi:hypothetical protein